MGAFREFVSDLLDTRPKPDPNRPEVHADRRRSWLDQAIVSAASRVDTDRHQRLHSASRLLETAESPPWVTTWPSSVAHLNADLRSAWTTLASRSTNLARNNEWAARWLIQLRDNVLGANGVRLQCRIAKARSTAQHTAANAAIEAAWQDWGKRGNCEASGLSWRQVEALSLQTLARTGEIFYRILRGAGPWGFQIQMLDPWALDLNLNAANGKTRIVMGVELDDFGKPIAYHLRVNGPNIDPYSLAGSAGANHVVLPARDVRHFFAIEEPGQVRGVPWLSIGARRLWMAQKFEEAVSVASTNSAQRLGFFVSPTGDAPAGFADQIISSVLDQARAAGKLLTPEEVQQLTAAAEKYSTTVPGQYDTIPAGYDFRQYDSPWPNVESGEYVKSMIRGWTAARGASYHTIGNDLEGVNYSSARVGILDEREHYKVIQQDLIDWLHSEVIAEWMPIATLKTTGLQSSRVAEYIAACTWRPRRWAGIDPLKEAQANESELTYGLTSRTRIILERGDDPEEIASEREQDEELFGELPGELTASGQALSEEQPGEDSQTDPTAGDPDESAPAEADVGDTAQSARASRPVVRLSKPHPGRYF